MPVHGSAPFLTTALESVYKSQDVEIEFILILDRCTNSYLQEVVRASPPNIEVKVFKSDSPGIVPALNLGIKMAKHEVIARLDSDDLVTPERFRKQVEFLNIHKEVVCVGTQLTFIDEAGVEFGYTNYPKNHADILDQMRYQNCVGHPSVMFRKFPVQQIGGYREFLTGSEDYDLWLRLSEIGYLSNLPLKLTKYRKSKFQFTNEIKSTQPLTESACRISVAMRRLQISDYSPKENEFLGDFNARNLIAVQLLDSKKSNEIKAADYLNQAYREWTSTVPIIRRLAKVTENLLRAGYHSPELVVSFIKGRIKFHSIRDKELKRCE